VESFELLALRATVISIQPERLVNGRSRHENARDGLRPLEATARNATSRSTLWSGTTRTQIEMHHRMGR